MPFDSERSMPHGHALMYAKLMCLLTNHLLVSDDMVIDGTLFLKDPKAWKDAFTDGPEKDAGAFIQVSQRDENMTLVDILDNHVLRVRGERPIVLASLVQANKVQPDNVIAFGEQVAKWRTNRPGLTGLDRFKEAYKYPIGSLRCLSSYVKSQSMAKALQWRVADLKWKYGLAVRKLLESDALWNCCGAVSEQFQEVRFSFPGAITREPFDRTWALVRLHKWSEKGMSPVLIKTARRLIDFAFVANFAAAYGLEAAMDGANWYPSICWRSVLETSGPNDEFCRLLDYYGLGFRRPPIAGFSSLVTKFLAQFGFMAVPWARLYEIRRSKRYQDLAGKFLSACEEETGTEQGVFTRRRDRALANMLVHGVSRVYQYVRRDSKRGTARRAKEAIVPTSWWEAAAATPVGTTVYRWAVFSPPQTLLGAVQDIGAGNSGFSPVPIEFESGYYRCAQVQGYLPSAQICQEIPDSNHPNVRESPGNGNPEVPREFAAPSRTSLGLGRRT